MRFTGTVSRFADGRPAEVFLGNHRVDSAHVTTIGTALDQGSLSARIAIQLVEQTAPGCIDAMYLALLEGIALEQVSIR